MRTVGIILLLLGALSIASGVLQLGAATIQIENADPSPLQRMDAIIPGLMLLGIGFVITAMSKRPTVITATPADQWLSVNLTAEAAEFAQHTARERGYPIGSGLRIAERPSGAGWVVQFDLPPDGEQDWLGENKGVPIFADASLARQVMGATIELRDGELALTDSSSA